MVNREKAKEHIRALMNMGCVTVVFLPEELRGADPIKVENRLIEQGWDIIDALATEPVEDL